MIWKTLSGARPRVIAHRGASGLFPEHTLAGYQHALDAGADIIEPDLVPSRDGVLFCRHDLGLKRSTDIATRAEFAGRAVDGDWRCIDFDATEIARFGAIQPFPHRPQQHNGAFPPPRFGEALAWAVHQAERRGSRVRLYPEIKHPSDFAMAGVDPVELFVEAVAALPDAVEVDVQCFEVEPLRRVFQRTGLACTLLVDSSADPWVAMHEHAGWLSALGLSKRWLFSPRGAELVEEAHRWGLRIDAWTFRDDMVGDGFASIEDELTRAFQLGADALFCDFPDTALAVREQLESMPFGQD